MLDDCRGEGVDCCMMLRAEFSDAYAVASRLQRGWWPEAIQPLMSGNTSFGSLAPIVSVRYPIKPLRIHVP